MSLATSIESLRLMRLPEVLRITGFSRSTLLAMVARGDFPAPLRIGRRGRRLESPGSHRVDRVQAAGIRDRMAMMYSA